MRRSKLELYLDILRALNHSLPLKPTQIMYDVNVCYRFLELYLEFLIKQNLVERLSANGQRVTYTITQKGVSLLKTYGELKKTLPIEWENGNRQGFLMH